MDSRAYIYFPMLPPRGRDAALAHARQLVDYLAAVRPVWSIRPPEIPGRYWLRMGREDRPEVVEIRADYSEPGAPLVVQIGDPADRGVEFLNHIFFAGAEWCGPLELPGL